MHTRLKHHDFVQGMPVVLAQGVGPLALARQCRVGLGCEWRLEVGRRLGGAMGGCRRRWWLGVAQQWRWMAPLLRWGCMHVQHFPENSDESYVLCVLMSLGWLWRLGMCCLTVGWLGGWGCVVSHWGVWGIGVWWEGGDDT